MRGSATVSELDQMLVRLEQGAYLLGCLHIHTRTVLLLLLIATDVCLRVPCVQSLSLLFTVDVWTFHLRHRLLVAVSSVLTNDIVRCLDVFQGLP